MRGFRESLMQKVSELAEQLEERLFHLYGFHNELIQERLQAVAEVMERVEEVQAELRHVCCTVEAAYRDLLLQPELSMNPSTPRDPPGPPPRRTLVGVDGLEVHEVPDDVELVADPVAPQHVPRVPRDAQRLPARVPLQHRHHLGGSPAGTRTGTH
uniref:Uncharacterized protein n=1 Tax=Corvus moneduloides TaxID=1196302 RepID=A0A8U7NYB1_CORMO